MNRDQVKEVFKLIKNAYSQFEATTEKVDVWDKLLKDQNVDVIMRNAEQHILTNKFPPVIADLREHVYVKPKLFDPKTLLED
jgi:hypothetical protein